MKFTFTLIITFLSVVLIAQKPGNLQVSTSPQIEKLQADYLSENKNENYVNGYRVQIYNGNKNNCMQERSRFLQMYPSVEAYTLYESPEYRIQVGDFRTRLEAEKFKRQVLEHHSGSFVLQTKIKWPKVNSQP
jgi:hypothetical protein